MIVGNRDWLQPTTFAEAVDATLPLGKVYLPDGSYREMTEWALPPPRLVELQGRRCRRPRASPAAERLKPFVRAGGFWRNFKARYAESDEMYARMLGVSHRLAAAEADRRGRPRLPRRRPPGALPRPVQLPLLARRLRRPLSAPPPQRHLPPPDRRAQRARRRRGADRPPRRDRGRRLQPRRPPGSPARERPPDRLRPARDRRPRLRARRPPRPDERPGHARPPPRGLSRRDRRGGRHPARTTTARRASRTASSSSRRGSTGCSSTTVTRARRWSITSIPLDVTLDDLAACRDVERGDFVAGRLPVEGPAAARSGSRSSMERPGWADGHAIQRPQDDRARRRLARRSTSTTSSTSSPRASRSTSPSRSTSRRWPATPTTAITPTPTGDAARDARRPARPARSRRA